MFPGGVPSTPQLGVNTSFGSGLGIRPGFGNVPYRRGNYGYGYGRGVVAVPVPVYVGGYGYTGYYEEPQVVVQQPFMQGPAAPPAVIINQNFQPEKINPVVRDYSNADLPEPTMKAYGNTGQAATPNVTEDKATIYLVALKDGTILATLATWVDGDTLNYITRDNNRNQISLDRVDRDFSTRLNAERGLEVRFQ